MEAKLRMHILQLWNTKQLRSIFDAYTKQLTDHSGLLSKTFMITWSLTAFPTVFPCNKTTTRDYTSFVANEVTAYLQTISWNNIWNDTDVNKSFFQIWYKNRITNEYAPSKTKRLAKPCRLPKK